MKNLLLVFSVLIMLCISPAAEAGFVVKNASFFSETKTTTSVAIKTNAAIKEKSSNIFAKINDRLSFLHPYHMYKTNQWFGIAALGCGILGLIVPGVNLLAILFGVLGMGRGCRQQGLAVTGFVMGVLELALFLILQTVFVSLILL